MATHPIILIVTATITETRAVLDVFGKDSTNPKTVFKERVYFDLGLISENEVYLTQSEMGSGGVGSSQQAINESIKTLKPMYVIMVGIAFGIDRTSQAIGDILVSKQLRPYENQRIGTGVSGDVRVIHRGDKPHASTKLLNLVRSAEITWQGAKIKYGTLLSGEKLVDNYQFIQELLDLEPEAIGGEMEGAGLYLACYSNKVDWIIVKAICDFADGTKGEDKDNKQKQAARNSAELIHHVLCFGYQEDTSLENLIEGLQDWKAMYEERIRMLEARWVNERDSKPTDLDDGKDILREMYSYIVALQSLFASDEAVEGLRILRIKYLGSELSPMLEILAKEILNLSRCADDFWIFGIQELARRRGWVGRRGRSFDKFWIEGNDIFSKVRNLGGVFALMANKLSSIMERTSS